MSQEPPSVRALALQGRRFVRLYGARLRHLLLLKGCFALTGYTIRRLLGGPAVVATAVWFVGAALAWDLLV